MKRKSTQAGGFFGVISRITRSSYVFSELKKRTQGCAEKHTPFVAKQKTNDTENTIHKLAESTFLPLFTNLCKKKQKGTKHPIKIRRSP